MANYYFDINKIERIEHFKGCHGDKITIIFDKRFKLKNRENYKCCGVSTITDFELHVNALHEDDDFEIKALMFQDEDWNSEDLKKIFKQIDEWFSGSGPKWMLW